MEEAESRGERALWVEVVEEENESSLRSREQGRCISRSEGVGGWTETEGFSRAESDRGAEEVVEVDGAIEAVSMDDCRCGAFLFRDRVKDRMDHAAFFA